MIKVASFDGSFTTMDQKTIENYIRYCLHLSKQGLGSVSPNPPVGAILVHRDTIIGEGYHKQFGGAHAEVNAIDNVPDEKKHLIKDSCLIVSLEPCNHHGKTPPCTQLILKHEIKKIIFGSYDPNPKISGTSIDFLRYHGVEPIGPILEQECKKNIREFAINITKQRPYIILKFAQSADFMMGIEQCKIKISNSYTDVLTHKWRTQIDGILVGSQTVRVDNPKLTSRLWPGKNPVRIVWGKFTEQDKLNFNVFDDKAVTWSSSELINERAITLKELIDESYRRNIGILMVEGGPKTIKSFYEEGLWDEARIITNTTLYLKKGISAPSIQGRLENKLILDKDVIHYIANYQID